MVKGLYSLGSSIILFNTLFSLKLSHFIGTFQFNLCLVSDFLTYQSGTFGTFQLTFLSLFVWESYLIRSSWLIFTVYLLKAFQTCQFNFLISISLFGTFLLFSLLGPYYLTRSFVTSRYLH